MRMLACLMFVSFLACAQSIKCVRETRMEVHEEDKEAAIGLFPPDSPPDNCTSPEWCVKLLFDGTTTKNGVTVKNTAVQSDCVTGKSMSFYKKMYSKCHEIGNDCKEWDDIEMGKDEGEKKNKGHVLLKGDMIVCCCNTDLCNGSGTTVASVFVMLLAHNFLLHFRTVK